MPSKILIIQSEQEAANVLADYFTRQDVQVWHTTSLARAGTLAREHQPDLVIFDLRLPRAEWVNIVHGLQKSEPAPGFIGTSRLPDPRRELQAQEVGVRVFLHEPFTDEWIEAALRKLQALTETPATPLPVPAEAPAAPPQVAIPVRVKITLPYALLAIVFVLAAAYLIGRYLLESSEQRFNNQLVDAGRIAADTIVDVENSQLGTLRLIANTQGLADAVLAGDAENARLIAFPLAVNAQEEEVEIVDLQGVALISLRRAPDSFPTDLAATRGDTRFAAQPFVLNVLLDRADTQGDKFAGLVEVDGHSLLYVAGPVYDAGGRLVGAVLVGRSIHSLLATVRQNTLAQVSLYAPDGELIDSTLFGAAESLAADQAQSALSQQDRSSLRRTIALSSGEYAELIGPWEVRGGTDLGLLGIALAQNLLPAPSLFTGGQATVAVLAIFGLVILIGLSLARRITGPLEQIVAASSSVANGRLEVKVDTTGNDELAVLGHAFNKMVSGLQEGSIYRDLLGRSVSPEVRDEMRASFASGNVRLEGQTTYATILKTDVRGFTTVSEKEDPTTVLRWLNEYFGDLVPAITAHDGVVDKFEGDAVLAFFGILPSPLSPQDSAYQACLAALGMLEAVDDLNARRLARDEPPFITGIGLNSGPVTAGGLGASDRLNYTIIGDTVNTAQRLEGFTRNFGETGIVVGASTVTALKERAEEFVFEPLGEQVFRGKTEALMLYRLRGRTAPRLEA